MSCGIFLIPCMRLDPKKLRIKPSIREARTREVCSTGGFVTGTKVC